MLKKLNTKLNIMERFIKQIFSANPTNQNANQTTSLHRSNSSPTFNSSSMPCQKNTPLSPKSENVQRLHAAFQRTYLKLRNMQTASNNENAQQSDNVIKSDDEMADFLQKRSSSMGPDPNDNQRNIGIDTKIDIERIYADLMFYLNEIHKFFEPTNPANSNISQFKFAIKLHSLADLLIKNLNDTKQLRDTIDSRASAYDLDAETKKNGYRSLVAAYDKCCAIVLSLVKEVFQNKSNITFQIRNRINETNDLKELDTYEKLIQNFVPLLQLAHEMQLKTFENSSLFLHADSINFPMEKKLLLLANMNPEAYFGRSCAFQFCDSLKGPLTACAIALASYNDGYYAYQNNQLGITAKSLFSGTKYFLNPELRALKLAEIMKHADVEFCKAFWQLTETSVVQVGYSFIF